MLHNYTRLIMPQFSSRMEMSSSDFSTFCQLSCHYVSFFRSCFAMKLSSEHSNEGVLPYLTSLTQQVGHQTSITCSNNIQLGSPLIKLRRNEWDSHDRYLVFQIKNISQNKILVREYDLDELITKIDNCDLKSPNITAYNQHYPQSDDLVETIKTVQGWPRMSDGTWSPLIISIMSLILALNINIDMFTNTKLMEKIQLQYALLLQRYLK